MTDQLKEKKTRTPRNYDSILNGALLLSLEDRVKLVKAVSEASKLEVEQKKTEAANAEAALNGL